MFGVTSWGDGCALAAKPGIYADVRSRLTLALWQYNQQLMRNFQVFSHGSSQLQEVNANCPQMDMNNNGKFLCVLFLVLQCLCVSMKYTK